MPRGAIQHAAFHRVRGSRLRFVARNVTTKSVCTRSKLVNTRSVIKVAKATQNDWCQKCDQERASYCFHPSGIMDTLAVGALTRFRCSHPWQEVEIDCNLFIKLWACLKWQFFHFTQLAIMMMLAGSSSSSIMNSNNNDPWPAAVVLLSVLFWFI